MYPTDADISASILKGNVNEGQKQTKKEREKKSERTLLPPPKNKTDKKKCFRAGSDLAQPRAQHIAVLKMPSKSWRYGAP